MKKGRKVVDAGLPSFDFPASEIPETEFLETGMREVARDASGREMSQSKVDRETIERTIEDTALGISRDQLAQLSAADQQQTLQLRAKQLRQQAFAARLEAKAAEIEWRLQCLSSVPSDVSLIPSASTGRPEPTVTRVTAQESAAAGPRVNGRTIHPPAALNEPQSSRKSGNQTASRSRRVTIDKRDASSLHRRSPAALASVVKPTVRHAASDASSLPDTASLPNADCDPSPRTKRRPAAWVASAGVHVIILLALALVGIQTHRPKDQVSLSASSSPSEDFTVETISVEAVEPNAVTEPKETAEVTNDLQPNETFEVSEIGSESLSEAITSAALSQSLSVDSLSSAALESLKSDTPTTTQFCGVEGGGNHFIYLVDSSKSMGEAFASARRELLASIDALSSDQRFYVIFFDDQPDYMRISRPDADEPHSVTATQENKHRLRQWAMSITMNSGKAPYDPLRFALQQQPDVIFLLSDGEFPQRIEELLQAENKTENVFGDSNPISIVHTIGYHSQQGEQRMRQIAQANGGQYRYIPAPPKRSVRGF